VRVLVQLERERRAAAGGASAAVAAVTAETRWKALSVLELIDDDDHAGLREKLAHAPKLVGTPINVEDQTPLCLAVC